MKLIIEDDRGRRTVVPLSRGEVSIGRLEGNTVQLTERNVSRHHALLLRQSDGVLIEDLNSFNGVRVNGDRIHGRLPVREGDLIQIGDYDLALEHDSEPELVLADLKERSRGPKSKTKPERLLAAEPEVQAQPEPVAPAVEAPPPGFVQTGIIQALPVDPSLDEGQPIPVAKRPRLAFLNTAEAGRIIPLERTEVLLGRLPSENDIAVDHRSVSKTHARLSQNAQGGWRVFDLGSSNGLRINGEKYGDAPVGPGDVIELGHVRLRFLGPGERISLTDPGVAENRPNSWSFFLGAALLFLLGGAGFAFLLVPRWEAQRLSAPNVVPPSNPTSLAPTPRPLSVPLPAVPPLAPLPVERPEVPAPPETVKVERHRAAPGHAAERPSLALNHPDRRAEGDEAYQQALGFIDAGDYVSAVGNLQRAIELDPTLAEAHKALGLCYTQLREPEKGAYQYEQYLKLKPDAPEGPELRRMLGDYYRSAKETP